MLVSHNKFFMSNEEQNPSLSKLLLCFNFSFQQPDITLYKFNLEIFHQLHDKHQLFAKKHVLRWEFVQTFLATLLRKTHNSLRFVFCCSFQSGDSEFQLQGMIS